MGAGNAKGWTLGRPRLALDSNKVASLRTQGKSLRAIAAQLGCSDALVNKSLSESRAARAEKQSLIQLTFRGNKSSV